MQNEIISIDSLTEELSKYGTVEAIKEGVVFSLLLTGHEMSKMIKFQSIQKLVLDYTQDKYPYVELLQNSDTYFYMILKPNSQDPHEERGVHILKPINSIVSVEKYWRTFENTEEYQLFSEDTKSKCRLGFDFGMFAYYWAKYNIDLFDPHERKLLEKDLNEEVFNIIYNLNTR